MPRKLFYVGFSFLAGAILSALIPVRYSCIIVVAAVIALVLIFLITNGVTRKKLIIIIISFSLALFQNILYTLYVYNPIVAYSGKTVEIIGDVISIEEYSDDTVLVRVECILEDKYKTNVEFFSNNTALDYYDTVYVRGTAKLLEDTLKYRNRFYSKPYNEFITVSSVERIKVIEKSSFSVKSIILSFQNKVYDNIISVLDNDSGALLAAMLCGDTSDLSDATSSNMFKSGIGHITSVSGTHLVLVTSITAFFLHMLKVKKVPYFMLTEAMVWLFAVFAGMSSSVIRAAVMTSVVLSAKLFRRNADSLNSLGICALIMLFGNPYGALSISFLLSFFGAFGIGVFAPYMLRYAKFKRFKKLKISLLTSLYVTVCVFPLTVLFFNQASIISPLANVVLIPLCSIALYITVISVVLIPFDFVFELGIKLAGIFTLLVLKCSDAIASLPFTSIPTYSAALRYAVYTSAAVIIILKLLKRSRKVIIKALSVCVSLALLINCVNLYKNWQRIRLTVINDKNSLILLLYNSNNSVIINMFGNSDYISVCQRYIDMYGINNLEFAVSCVNTKSFIEEINTNLYLSPKIIYSLDEVESNSYTYDVINKNSCHLNVFGGELYVSQSRFIYEFEDIEFSLSLNRNSVSFNGEEYRLFNSEKGEAVIFEINEHPSIRRLNYALR